MAFCIQCGAQLAADARFCRACGRPQPEAGTQTAQSGPGPSRVANPAAPGGSLLANEPPPLVSAILVVVVCGVVSAAGWGLFSLPARIPTWLIRVAFPSQVNCTGYATQTAGMYLCAGKVAFLYLLGPLLITVLLFVYRARLAALVRGLSPRLPPGARFLVAPTLATVAFALAWAGAHYEVGAGRGLVSQRAFPAFIGLFTYAVTRWGGGAQARLGAFFDVRDRYPTWMRALGALAVPLVISLVITFQDRVTQPILKEQVIVLISIAVGWLALTPRTGGLAGVLRR